MNEEEQCKSPQSHIILMDYATRIPNAVFEKKHRYSGVLEVLSISYYAEEGQTLEYLKNIIRKVNRSTPENPSPLESEVLNTPTVLRNRILSDAPDVKKIAKVPNTTYEQLKIAKAFLTSKTQQQIPPDATQEWFEQYVLNEQDGKQMGWELYLQLEVESPFVHIDRVTTLIQAGTSTSNVLNVIPASYDIKDVETTIHTIYQSIVPDFRQWRQFANISHRVREDRARDALQRIRKYG